MTAEARIDKGAELGDLAIHGRKFEKALATARAGGVKESRFLPSGRRIFTVVGNLGDEFIDPEKPYCSCSNFFFKVSEGKERTCYHLLSYEIARRSARVDVVEFGDDEYAQVLSAIVSDVFDVMSKS
jgi:predicted nucleic acid-binding Zn finger protein